MKVEELYYPCSEKKALISFTVTAKLIRAFVFAYAKCRFSHDAAHLILGTVFHYSLYTYFINVSSNFKCCVVVKMRDAHTVSFVKIAADLFIFK